MKYHYKLDFEKQDGFIPAIIQEYKTGDVLMLGYMNPESFELTATGKYVTFWSRSKKRLWMKGEESGDKLIVKEIYTDCDSDTVLIKVEMVGKNVCHEGKRSCFFKKFK